MIKTEYSITELTPKWQKVMLMTIVHGTFRPQITEMGHKFVEGE